MSESEEVNTLKRLLVLLAAGCLASVALAQTGVHVVGPTVKAESGRPNPERQKYGAQLLQIAEADAGGLQGGMRAWALWQVARGYERTDKAKAIELLGDALTATRGMDQGRLNPRAMLQEQILKTLAPLAPQQVDEALPTVDPQARKAVLRQMLSYYQQQKQPERVIELLYRIANESEMPYDAAAEAMAAMKPEQRGELLQLFTTCFTSYRDHAGPDRMVQMGGGFPEMVARFWQRLPANLVRQAIDEVLKQTDPANAKDAKPAQFSMASDKGTVAFGSAYEYHLFQFLPILKEVDSSAAEQYLKKYREVATMLEKYPQGARSLYSPDDPSAQKQASRATYSVGGAPGENMTPFMLDMQKVQKLTADAEAGHAQDALANVPTISSAQLRGAAYHNIARAVMKKQPSVAREAIEKMLDTGEKLGPDMQLMAARAAADVYVILGDNDSAKKQIERGISLANTVYKQESNADDPNLALKAYWTATDSYRALLRQAGKVDPGWALTLLKEIFDPEVKVAAEITLAGTWLDVPMGQSVVMTITKKNSGVMIGGVEAE